MEKRFQRDFSEISFSGLFVCCTGKMDHALEAESPREDVFWQSHRGQGNISFHHTLFCRFRNLILSEVHNMVCLFTKLDRA